MEEDELSGLLNRGREIHHPDRAGELCVRQDEGDGFAVPATIPTSQRSSSVGRRGEPTRPERRIVFVDLDNTLFDYTGARQTAATRALEQMTCLDVSISEALSIYNAIVERWQLFQALGFQNFRRQWNDDDIYLLVATLSSVQPRGAWPNALADLEALQSPESLGNRLNTQGMERVEGLVGHLASQEAAAALAAALFRARADPEVQQSTERARVEFDKATERLQPMKGAPDFLQRVTEVANAEVFIVTEGDGNIQREKVEQLGLHDLVSPHHIVVTEEFVQSREDRLALGQAIHSKEMPYMRGPGAAPDLTNQHKSDFEMKLLKYFRSLLEKFRHKEDGWFYARALHSVATLKPGSRVTRLSFTNVSPDAWARCQPIKLAVVGDRWSTDLRPPISILGPSQVRTIRLLFGKYSREKARNPRPDHTVRSLAEATDILLKASSWLKKDPVERPPLLGERIDAANVPYVIAGLSGRLPAVVRLMAGAILDDHRVPSECVDRARSWSEGPIYEWREHPELRSIVQEIVSNATS